MGRRPRPRRLVGQSDQRRWKLQPLRSCYTLNNPSGLLDVNNKRPSITAITSLGGSPGYRSSYGLNSWFDVRYPFGNNATNGVGTNPNGNTKKNTFPPNYIDIRRPLQRRPARHHSSSPTWSGPTTRRKPIPAAATASSPPDYGPSTAAPLPADLTGDSQSAPRPPLHRPPQQIRQRHLPRRKRPAPSNSLNSPSSIGTTRRFRPRHPRPKLAHRRQQIIETLTKSMVLEASPISPYDPFPI